MASRILCFPADPDAFRRSAAQRSLPDAILSAWSTPNGSQPAATGASSAAGSSRHQASRIARQVEREIGRKVQREGQEQMALRKPPQRQVIVLSPRDGGAFRPDTPDTAPAGLRHRLLDALLFFGRPA